MHVKIPHRVAGSFKDPVPDNANSMQVVPGEKDWLRVLSFLVALGVSDSKRTWPALCLSGTLPEQAFSFAFRYCLE
jgi:hypothetical protein